MPHVNADCAPFTGSRCAVDNIRPRRAPRQMVVPGGCAGRIGVIALCAVVLGALASTAQAQTPAGSPPPPAPQTEPQQGAAGTPPPSSAYPPPPGYQATSPDGTAGTYPAAPGYPTPPPGYSQPPAGYGTAPAPYAPPQSGYGAPGAGYPPGYPAPYAYAPPPRNEHDGFYLRLHLGFGFTRVATSGSSRVGDEEFSGGSGSLGIALGGVVAPNLVLYGTFFGSSVPDPDVKVDGTSFGQGQGSADLVGVGGGVAYYFQPVNIYIAGALSSMKFSLSDSDNNTQYESKWGVGIQGMVGKEWWVSQEWGLGVAAEFMGATMKDQNDSGVTWKAGAFSLLFSATYN